MTDLEHLLQEHGAPPEHAPGFEDRLWTAIAADGWRGEGAGVDGPAAAPVAPFTSRRVRLLASLAAAAAVVALAVGIAVTRHTVRELGNPTVASAAEVAANVRAALADIRTLSVESTWSFRNVVGPPRAEWRQDWTTADWWSGAVIKPALHSASMGRIVATADGQWRMDHPEGDEPPVMVDRYVLDQATGVMKTYWPSESTLYVTKDTSLGPPDSWMGEYTVGWSVDVSFIRPANLQAMAGGRVGETTYDGRPALTVSCAIAPVPIKGLDMGSHLFDTVEYTVDRETWLVVRASYLLRGQVVQQTSLSDVHVNEPLSDAQFQLSPPKGTRTQLVTKSEVLPLAHFRRVSFGEAAHTFSTPPLEPGALPQGFSPFAAAVADKASLRLIWTYTDGYQPELLASQPGRHAAQLQLRLPAVPGHDPQAAGGRPSAGRSVRGGPVRHGDGGGRRRAHRWQARDGEAVGRRLARRHRLRRDAAAGAAASMGLAGRHAGHGGRRSHARRAAQRRELTAADEVTGGAGGRRGCRQASAAPCFSAFLRCSVLRMCLRTRTMLGVTSTSSSSAIHSSALSRVMGRGTLRPASMSLVDDR